MATETEDKDEREDESSETESDDMELSQLVQWVDDWESATMDAREESERDRDYYDGKQWTAEETATITARGQAPIVINRIAKKINYLLGTEIRTRSDPDAFPRTPQDEDAAQAVSDALRYIADQQNLPQVFSEAFESVVVEGYGGVVVEAPDGEVTVRAVPWDRLIYDPHSRRWDFSDARYVGVAVWMDKDEAREKYLDSDDAIDGQPAGGDGDTLDDRPRQWIDSKRNRVRVVELYYRDDGEWYVAHFTQSGFLVEPMESPYQDELGDSVCPLLMVSAYVDRQNNRYGLVRGMISPQDELNHRRSKALHLISTRQAVTDRGAVDVETVKSDLGKPDALIEVESGMRFELLPTGDMTHGQLALLAEAKSEIDTIGPDAGTIAGSSAGQSGRAVLARQQLASLELERLFDHFRTLKEATYRHCWYRIRQSWTGEKWLRVRDEGEKTGYRFVALNRKMTRAQYAAELIRTGSDPMAALSQAAIPETGQVMQAVQQQAAALAQQTGQQLPPMAIMQHALQVLSTTPGGQEFVTRNDVAQLDVDIELGEGPDTTVLQQEEFEELAAMAGRGMPIPPELIIEASHLRNKKRLLELLQKPGPGAEQAQQMQQAMATADLHKTQSEAAKNAAQAQKYMAETQVIPASAQRDQAQAMLHAANAGAKVGQIQQAIGEIV
jgi:hypothetical protein